MGVRRISFYFFCRQSSEKKTLILWTEWMTLLPQLETCVTIIGSSLLPHPFPIHWSSWCRSIQQTSHLPHWCEMHFTWRYLWVWFIGRRTTVVLRRRTRSSSSSAMIMDTMFIYLPPEPCPTIDGQPLQAATDLLLAAVEVRDGLHRPPL